jgi:hypothetical protein
MANIPRFRTAPAKTKRSSYFPACHSLTRLAISTVMVSRIADGVREKRGAGAGWVTP